MSTTAPRRTAVGPEAGFAAIERAFKADPSLAGRLITHIRNLPRRERVRVEAEEQENAERAAVRTRRRAARRLGINETAVGPAEMRRFYEIRTRELEAEGRTLIASHFRLLSRQSDPGRFSVDVDRVAEAVASAEQLLERATHEPDLALSLAQSAERSLPHHLIGEVPTVPEVREQLRRREAEERREIWRRQLDRGSSPSELEPPDNDVEDEVFRECQAQWSLRGGARVR